MRLLAYLLRHRLQEVQPDGYVDIALLEDKSGMTRSAILQAVASDPKQRYELSTRDGTCMIRACQGHTLPQVDTKLLGIEITEWNDDPPRHNTHRTNFRNIQKQGLSPMKRRHVHFATEKFMLREQRDLCLSFDLARWIKDGHKAYMSTNGVVMVDTVVPFEYLNV